MKYDIRKNWLECLHLITRKPVLTLPFIIIAFLEGLALELLYFSVRPPMAYLAAPVIKKFFGPAFLHYPSNLVILPKLFYYTQIMIYVFCGAFLAAVSVTIFKNIKSGLPLKTSPLVKNTLKRYVSFLSFALLMVVLLWLLKKSGLFIFAKIMKLVSARLPQIILKLIPLISTLGLFLMNIVLQVFLVLTIPILVLRKKTLFKALAGSINLAWRNFSSLFTLLFLPFLLYLPIALLKTVSTKLIQRTFPEITLLLIAAGIILAAVVECFIIVAAAQFLLDKDAAK